MNRYLNTGIPKIIGSTVEVVGTKKDGTEVSDRIIFIGMED